MPDPRKSGRRSTSNYTFRRYVGIFIAGMKLLPRKFLLVFALLAALVPVASPGDELTLEEKVSPGTVFLSYEGQNFRITTTTPVEIRFERVSPTLIHIEFVSASGTPGKISVYWLNFEKPVYNGQVPLLEAWEADLNTEGGFIDR